MSLILDALRRAETQRQTQIQPVYSLPSGHRSRSVGTSVPQPAVIGLIASALLVTAAAVAWMTIGSGRGADSNARASNVPPAAQAPASAVLTPPTGSRRAASASSGVAVRATSTPREVTSLSALARADDPRVVPPAPSATPRSAGGQIQVVEPTYGARSAVPASGGDITPGTVVVRDLLAEEGISTGGGSIAVSTPTPPPAQPPTGVPPPNRGAAASTSSANLQAAPTEFTLNMLSTSSDPANSYVYINMRRYAIGDQTPEGALVDDISNAGAVIRYRGQRYLLKSR